MRRANRSTGWRRPIDACDTTNPPAQKMVPQALRRILQMVKILVVMAAIPKGAAQRRIPGVVAWAPSSSLRNTYRVIRCLLPLAPLALNIGCTEPARLPATEVTGVWRVHQVVTSQGRVLDAQPGVYFFGRTHYSIVGVLGDGPRPVPADMWRANVPELRAIFGPFESTGRDL